MRENIPLLIAKKVLIFLVSVWLLSLAGVLHGPARPR